MTPDPDEPAGACTKKFWTYIKHCKQDKSGVAPLQDNSGSTQSSNAGKAAVLNQQFCSVFSKPTPLSLKHQCSRTVRHMLQEDQTPPETRSPHPTMPTINISVGGVTKLLTKLKPNKAAGPDQQKPRVLKEISEAVAPILTIIFQRSLDTGKLPHDWKEANVVPIYKKGPKYKPANYRPVSLTCICSKIMEHIIVTNMITFLEDQDILYDKQHGFRTKRSCETQLIEFMHELHNNMQKGTQVDAVVMDFSKAFDKVAHNRLSYKLDYYGVRGQTLEWINDFLRNRSQRVLVGGDSSEEAPVTSGVPQGSVLGPALFLVFINDLPAQVKSSVRLFADDTIVYHNIKSTQDCEELQQDLLQLEKWEDTWQMEFHPDKCNVIRIGKTKKPIRFNYSLKGHHLEDGDDTKYLGVTISKDLSWNKHLQNTTNSATRTLNFLKRNLKISSPKIKEQAYFSLVRPQLEYAASVWDPHTIKGINKVEMVQRRAARWVVNRFHNTSSVTNMLDHLGWRTLEHRRADQRLTMLYKIVNNLVAIDPGTYLQPVKRATRHSHQQGFIQYHTNRDHFRLSFFPRTIVQWNRLPLCVVQSPTAEVFKHQVCQLAHTRII